MHISRFNHPALRSVTLLLLGLIWIWLSRAPAGSTTQGQIPAPQKGFLAPDFSLQDASGQTVRLADLRGRPVIVNLWASWCIPCRSEMPALERVHRDYQDQGLALLGVNATHQDRRDAALAFAQEQGLTFSLLFDEQGVASSLYALRALPTTFFIDAEGIIQDVVVGGPMSEALLRIRVQQLIDRSAGERTGP